MAKQSKAKTVEVKPKQVNSGKASKKSSLQSLALSLGQLRAKRTNTTAEAA